MRRSYYVTTSRGKRTAIQPMAFTPLNLGIIGAAAVEELCKRETLQADALHGRSHSLPELGNDVGACKRNTHMSHALVRRQLWL